MIYRLKNILFFFLLIRLLIFVFIEIKFIKTSNDVRIKRKTITFTKDSCTRTVFINKMIKSGVMRMFIFFLIFIFIYSILLAKCYVFAQRIVGLLVSEIFFI
jgi:hypothetical protein